MRSFDPRRVGAFECRAWVAYYRREWVALLVASVGLVRAGFRMSWLRTLRGAWLVLRGNQLWAPADNDPDGARRCMERFYRLVARDSGEALDTVEAARLEVDWWRAHRLVQHGPGDGGEQSHRELVDALVRLYTFLYRTEPAEVAPAAALRVEAMDVSDRWVAEGCGLDSPLVARERALLVRSYAALLAAVHR
jgi:hypothetical protein